MQAVSSSLAVLTGPSRGGYVHCPSEEYDPFLALQVSNIPFPSQLSDKRPTLTSGNKLKSADWLTLTGPILKYIIAGSLGPLQQKVLFNYIDVLSQLWSKTFTSTESADVAAKCRTSLAEMELHFPS